jgi:hypothetical protein
MGWVRKGRIFAPEEHREWAGTHAQVPAVLALPDRLRVYYADRTSDNKSFMTYLDVRRDDPLQAIDYHRSSLMPYGAAGTFDDDGMMPGFVMHADGRVLLYYNGWNRGVSVPYRNSMGLAVSTDDGRTFARMFEGPIMDRTAREPYTAVTPTILREDALWRMWYVSGLRWVKIDEMLELVYVIKYASSADGITWDRPNHLCIPQRHDLEAYAHPTVVYRGGRYHMWFSFRDSRDFRDGAGAYRIGYAVSDDGLAWSRDDASGGLDVSAEGFDSRMTAYPYVIEVDGTLRLFYNGNGFGRGGIGYAVWEE